MLLHASVFMFVMLEAVVYIKFLHEHMEGEFSAFIYRTVL